MELRQLQYFVSIVDNHSFSAAAQENFISQSAISQQIKALEKELGYELITRENRSFSITVAGKYFYKESKRILSEINSMQVKAKLMACNDKYTLRVGYLIGYNGVELIEEIPYCDEDGQISIIYYAYWKKSISNPIIEAFAKILKSKF